MKPFSENLRYDLPLNQESRVLDVGCFEGNFSYEIWRRYGCKIIALEPVPEFYWRCVKKLSPVGVSVLPFALHKFDGKIGLGIHGGMSGVCAGGEQIVVESISLSSLMKNIGWDSLSLLKLNCENSEYAILESAIENGDIKKCSEIHVQYHRETRDAESLRAQIHREIQKTHTVEFDEDWVWTGYRLKP